ncbi:MAG: hypothetical protein QMC36_00885 [Patescibacteria group bacterium]
MKSVSERLSKIQDSLDGLPEDGKLSSYERKRRKKLVDELLLLQV